MSEEIIVVDPGTVDQDRLWREIYSKKKICRKIESLLSNNTPINDNCVRFVCISDTHEKLNELIPNIPLGDVLVHCGDFTNFGDLNAIRQFNEEMGKLPHKYKIVIAGNHDLGFEDNENLTKRSECYSNRGTSMGYNLLTNCIYLHDSFIKVYGINVYGSSWHPLPGFSFSRNRGTELLEKWLQIPAFDSKNHVDVLLTHTPPLGHSDLYYDTHWGCAELLNCVEKRIHPKFHIFGHVHERNGLTTNDQTIFVNASICNHSLNIIYSPIIFDIPLPDGVKKD